MRETLWHLGWLAAVVLGGVVAAQDEEKRSGGPNDMRRMMREMGMSEAEIVRHEMMMRLDVKTSDPAALLALREHLGLNEEQVHRLGVLREKTQAEALQALDEEQRKKVEALPAEPRTVAAMRRAMARRMEEKGKADGMCPMCRMKSGDG